MNNVGSTTSFKPVMNNIGTILHVGNRPFSVSHHDINAEKCVADSSTFLAIVTSSLVTLHYANMKYLQKS